jgi:hypothetical protein
MGGQACVLYGAAEFSRDTDFALLATSANFDRLLAALNDLRAECIAVPPPELAYLLRGHALHFRCRHPEAYGLRVAVMSRMRGVEGFETLWKRRTVLRLEPGLTVSLLSVPDLVQAKKTQRDKDWPMIRRLVEVHYLRLHRFPDARRIRFWLRELRSPELLAEAAQRYPRHAERLAPVRPLLSSALAGRMDRLETLLVREELEERRHDRAYWEPLRRELARLRSARGAARCRRPGLRGRDVKRSSACPTLPPPIPEVQNSRL